MPKKSKPAKRFWQDEALIAFQDIISYREKGQLILPTGAGKTRIAINMMESHMKRINRFGFYSVIVPRLLLSTQWVQEIATQWMGNDAKGTKGLGIPVTFVIISTGTISSAILAPIRRALYEAVGGHSASVIVTTTNPEEIRSQIHMRQKEAKSTIVAISTYHSSSRLAEATKVLSDEELLEKKTFNIGEVDICFCDECHNLVNGRVEEATKFEAAIDINAASEIYMTATPKLTDVEWEYAPGIEQKGMQNTNRFGRIVYTKSPLELMEAGGLVGPKAILITSEETIEVPSSDNGKSKLNVCHIALAHFRKDNAIESSSPEKKCSQDACGMRWSRNLETHL